MKNKKLLTSGQFAKMTGVNKRTLHYYNDINLLKPEYINEQGYHYYSIYQFAQLELILILRKVGLSLQEIKDYLTHTNDQNYQAMLEEKQLLIDQQIIQLQAIKQFLNQKSEHVKLSQHVHHGQISCIQLPQRKIILSQPISGQYDDNDFTIACQFSKQLKERFHLYDRFGSRIHTDAIYDQNFNQYDCYYAYCPLNTNTYDEILDEGTYIEAFCIGPWDLLPDIYAKIIHYAKEHHLKLCDYAYEEGLNEMSIHHLEDYITRITIKVEPID